MYIIPGAFISVETFIRGVSLGSAPQQYETKEASPRPELSTRQKTNMPTSPVFEAPSQKPFLPEITFSPQHAQLNSVDPNKWAPMYAVTPFGVLASGTDPLPMEPPKHGFGLGNFVNYETTKVCYTHKKTQNNATTTVKASLPQAQPPRRGGETPNEPQEVSRPCLNLAKDEPRPPTPSPLSTGRFSTYFNFDHFDSLEHNTSKEGDNDDDSAVALKKALDEYGLTNLLFSPRSSA